MNVFAAMSEPLRIRPGDALEPNPERLKRKTAPANPWGLTHAECTTLGMIAQVGSDKVAAQRLSVEPRTIETRMQRIRKKMQLPHRVLAVLAWDRFTRGAQA